MTVTTLFICKGSHARRCTDRSLHAHTHTRTRTHTHTHARTRTHVHAHARACEGGGDFGQGARPHRPPYPVASL